MIDPAQFLKIFPRCPICKDHLIIDSYKYSNSITCNGYDKNEDSFHVFYGLFIKDNDLNTIIMFQFEISDNEFIIDLIEQENGNISFIIKAKDDFVDSEYESPPLKEIELSQLPDLQEIADQVINKQIENLLII